MLVLPLYSKNNLSGFIGFDSVEKSNVWNNEDIYILKIISGIFGSAFERIQFENDQKKAFNEKKYYLRNCSTEQKTVLQ